MPAEKFVYFGSNDEGIFLSLFNEETREISEPRRVAGPFQSFFLARHPRKRVLYSAGASRATLAAFAIESDGALTPINEVASKGAVPCHPVLDPSGRFLLVANYNGGVAAFAIRPDGGLEEAADLFMPGGNGPDPKRQTGPHPHGIAIAPDGDLAYVADLGTDRVFALKIGSDPLSLTPAPELDATVAPGAGPRHVTLHRNGQFAVVVNEMANTVSAFRRDPLTHKLTPTGTLSTLPDGFSEETWTAEIDFHPLADVCYASNRGHGSLAIFPVKSAKGEIAAPRWLQTPGKKPQHFAFDGAGSTLFVANVDTDTVSIHRLEKTSGLPTGEQSGLRVSKPMCILPA